MSDDGQLMGIMTVMKVNYFHALTGFTVVTGETQRSGPKGITFKGVFTEYPEPGQIFCVKGRMAKDVKYDPPDYFKVEYARPQEVKNENGWIDYLVKECPGIAEMRALELVNAFGMNVLQKLAESRDGILALQSDIVRKPFTIKEADGIHQWAKKELQLSNMKAWLYQKGLGRALIGRIVGKHGIRAPQVVRNEPYSLTEIDGIGFLTADKIAKAVKIPRDSPQRIQAGLLHIMEQELENDGHTCILRHELVKQAQQLLGVHHNLVDEQINVLLSSRKLCGEETQIAEVSQFPFLFEDTFYD